MAGLTLVSDDDLARSRKDPAFRHQLVAHNLDMLLSQLKRMRNNKADEQSEGHIREGVDLAVRLAELLQSLRQPK